MSLHGTWGLRPEERRRGRGCVRVRVRVWRRKSRFQKGREGTRQMTGSRLVNNPGNTVLFLSMNEEEAGGGGGYTRKAIDSRFPNLGEGEV